jgi:Protein of unknown function (DUF2637)
MTTEIFQRHHRRAVRFFWALLFGATTVSLIGNVVHAVLPYIPPVIIQIGAAAVPPIALLAAVHGLGLGARAGASGRVYRWAVSAVAVIGVGAFALSFLALRDLMHVIGCGYSTAWVFPAIIDTAVATSALMLVALGGKPAPHARTSATAEVKASAPTAPALPRPHAVRADQVAADSALPAASALDQHADAGVDHTALAQALVDAGATTKTVALVASILSAHADGTARNRIASDTGIHHKTVSKIIDAAENHRRQHLVAV